MRFIRLTVFAAIFSIAASAQAIRIEGGPTVGATAPGFGHNDGWSNGWLEQSEERYQPSISPLIGFSVIATAWNHLAFDACLQWSWTGYRYTRTTESIGKVYRESLRLQRISLPVTMGYAFKAWNVPVRIGAGPTFSYIVSGRFRTHDETMSPTGTVMQSRDIRVLDDDDLYRFGLVGNKRFHTRAQATLRIAISLQPAPQLLLRISGEGGYPALIIPTGTQDGTPLNRAGFQTHSLDVTATYLLQH